MHVLGPLDQEWVRILLMRLDQVRQVVGEGGMDDKASSADVSVGASVFAGRDVVG